MTFEHVKRCLDLTDRDFDAALDDRDVCHELIVRISQVARPETGAPKVLLLFARMAREASPWLEGTLRVELMGDAEATTLEVMTDSAGLRERVFAPVALAVGLPEFAKAVQRLPHMIDPLEMVASTKRRMVFVADIEEPGEEDIPAIAPESLFEGVTPSAPATGVGVPLTFSLKTPAETWSPEAATRPVVATPPPVIETAATTPTRRGPSDRVSRPPSLPAENGWDDWGDLIDRKK